VKRTLTIVGASARAAAWSAVRAGFDVYAADLFADVDLAAVSRATRVSDYPAGLAEIVAGPQAGDWMYTGALENSPALVDRLAVKRRLLGNSGAMLRQVRQPQRVAQALRDAGLPFPDIVSTADGIQRDGSWLLKALRSAGGGQVRAWDVAAPRQLANGCYLQRRVEGASIAAAYVAAGGSASLLGVTRQLVGTAWTGAGGFQYCGSVGPVNLPADVQRQLVAIGQTLAREFSLTGLFGVDAIVNANEVWTLEVNPRYTASFEVLERAQGFSAIELHVAACHDSTLPSAPTGGAACVVGKAIVFATSHRVALAAWADTARGLLPARLANPTNWPALADVPPTGATVEAGWPILTLFASGTNESTVLEDLQASAMEILAASDDAAQ